MALFDQFLLASDVDGTLVDDQKQIPQRNALAIERFKSLGGHFAIATGRTQITCEDIAARAKTNTPIIVYNGGGIFDRQTKTFLWQRMLERDALIEPLTQLMARYPHIGVEINAGGEALIVSEKAPLDSFIVMHGFPYSRVHIADTPAQWFKVLLNAPKKSMLEAIEQDVRARFAPQSANGMTILFSGETYLELLPASKGEALCQLAAQMDIPRARTAAIGDYDNDLSMIEWAGFSAAVDNAIPAIKKAANMQVCACEEGAVADFLERIERELRASAPPDRKHV